MKAIMASAGVLAVLGLSVMFSVSSADVSTSQSNVGMCAPPFGGPNCH